MLDLQCVTWKCVYISCFAYYFQMRISFKTNKYCLKLHTSFSAMCLKLGLFSGIAKQGVMNHYKKTHITTCMHFDIYKRRRCMLWCCCLPNAAQATMSRKKNVPPFGAMVKRPARLPVEHNSKCALISTHITTDSDMHFVTKYFYFP